MPNKRAARGSPSRAIGKKRKTTSRKEGQGVRNVDITQEKDGVGRKRTDRKIQEVEHVETQGPEENAEISSVTLNSKGQSLQRMFPTQFQLDVKFNVVDAWVIGIGVTKNNTLLLCNWSNSNLLVMSEKGKQLATVKMDGKQWGIAMEEDKNTAWVTLPEIQSIQTVDIVTMKKGRLIKVQDTCYGIALIHDEIVLGGSGKIYIISNTGESKKIFDVGGGPIHSISVRENFELYYAQADEVNPSKLKCVGLDGTVRSASVEDINHVIDIKTDRKGNVYLLEYLSPNLKLFSVKDKSIKSMLTSKDNLTESYGFALRQDFSKLFISNYTTMEILVYLCK
ncbi:uncharacterized protein LOC127711988 [Mytilus californianus]|uniref:uncharacterized protein LOC127711988 n=1 Tax=Mytilus californianus TaxID=6549 RepID=UPI002247336F|nr:uncharacterized protein LOC127711988 [Mytilus californianus]